MAERRMFSKKIVDSDAFLDMPLSTQALYFQLAMRADDDGFVNSPKRIQRMIGASDDDFKILISKRFIIVFESGVIVIKHWKINNYIQKDRYNPTTYTDEKSTLLIEKNGAYTECIQNVYKSVYNLDTQYSIGKVSIGKNSIVVADLTEEEYDELCDTIGKADCDYYIERVKAFLLKHPDAKFSTKATILKWHRADTSSDTRPGEEKRTYETDKLNGIFNGLREDEL